MRAWLLLLIFLLGCSSPPAAAEHPASDGVADASALVLGEWSTYPPPDGETWPQAALDDVRWAQVTAELACAGRTRRGDPKAHRRAADAILQVHKTTAGAVMDHGIEINADSERAHRLGEQVAAAVQACR